MAAYDENTWEGMREMARIHRISSWNMLILATEGPLNTYQIWRKGRAAIDFSYIRYNVVNLRARERVYLGKYAERKAEKIDLVISIYQLTPRAYLAILLHRIGPNEFLEKSSTAQDLECPSRFLA